jgi:hypothetical protein
MDKIQRVNDDRLDELELSIVQNLQPVECPLVHRFVNGMYIREIFMPKDALITSKIHLTEHPFTISKGKVAVCIDGDNWQEFEAPYTGITKAGTRRVLYVIEDCVWTTFHKIDRMKSDFNDLSETEIDKIVEEIENEIFETHINYLTGTDITKEYKNILANKNILENKNQELWQE